VGLGKGVREEGRLLEQLPKDQFSCDSKARAADVELHVRCGDEEKAHEYPLSFFSLNVNMWTKRHFLLSWTQFAKPEPLNVKHIFPTNI
jgi:hypothetical protein